MVEYNVHGAGAPPGVISVNNDGSPNIRLGETYYTYSGAPAGMTIRGGRVWTPAGSPATTRIMLFAGGSTNGVKHTVLNLDTVPLRSVEVATNIGGWTEARWAPVTPPDLGYRFMIAYEFVENDDVYVFSSGFGGRPVVNSTAKVAKAEEDLSAPFGPVSSLYFKIGAGSPSPAPNNTYCTDVIMEVASSNVPPVANAGIDQSVNINTLVTLNGSGSTDSDGTIAGYTWTQVGGTAVALSGAGASRTFTPVSAGTYTFGLVVTDDLGATSSQDLITVTVVNPNQPPAVDAGVDRTVVVGNVVNLTANVTLYNGKTLNTGASGWSRVSGPAATITPGATYSATVTPATTGSLVLSYTATDSAGLVTVDQVIITVVSGGGGGSNTIAAENSLAGRARNAWFDGVEPDQLPGFARSSYYLPGQTVQFAVQSNNDDFDVEIHRLGWYNGDGARLVTTITGDPVNQAAGVVIPNSNGAITCAAWITNAMWSIPLDATPGWYYALIRNTSTPGTFGNVLFCVSDANAKKSVVVVSSESTWMGAYNGFGAKNIYGDTVAIGNSLNRSLCVSYDRPVITQKHVPQTHFFNGEYATLRFLERMGYEVGYTTNEQIDADPTILDGRSVIIFSGHNEYVSQRTMNKTKALINAGVHVVNFAANDFFWRIRYGTTDDTAITTRGRVMWCRKDTMPGPDAHVAGVPFVNDADWQGTWQDTRWPLREPSETFLGDRFIANGIRNDQIIIQPNQKSAPIWRDSSVASSGSSTPYAFGLGSAGMEWDRQSGSIPHVKLSSATVDLTGQTADENGQNYNLSSNSEHSIFIARANGTSGFIFNFNTTQWGWLLDNFHLRGTAIQDSAAQQATLNVLADLGILPNASRVSLTPVLVYPTPVGNVASAYGLQSGSTPPPNPNPDPDVDPSTTQLWYSDGLEWYPL